MKRFAIGIGIVAAIALGCLVFQRLSPARPVKEAVANQVALWNADDMQGLYETFSPRLQAICPFEAFDRLATQGKTMLSLSPLSADVNIEHIHVMLSGETADVTGVVTVGGRTAYPLSASSPAQYVHTPNGWLLDSIGGEAADNACANGILPIP